MGIGKEYLKNKEKVLDMRKSFEKQKVILADCYYWKDVYEALRLERKDELDFLKKLIDEFTEGEIDGNESPEIKFILNRISELIKEVKK